MSFGIDNYGHCYNVYHDNTAAASFRAISKKAWLSGRFSRAAGAPSSAPSRMSCTRGIRPSRGMSKSAAILVPPYLDSFQIYSTVGIPSLQSATMQTDNPSAPRHDVRWFEADASYKGADYFDKFYGRGKEGYVTDSPIFFDKDSFVAGNYSSYINPRTGRYNGSGNPISGKFEWTDIFVHIPVIGLIPTLFYL